jgi:hypothetical protein
MLVTLLARCQVLAHDAITAPGKLAGAATGIVVAGVAVVAGLEVPV